MIQKMLKPQIKISSEPVCKKIQNYIFKFTDLLGKGNFSKVYKAHHQLTNQIVAIKIIQLNSLKSQKLQELLFSQIDVLKKLNHANILRCFQVFSSNRNCYIITQLCNGGDLQSKLRKQHHFSEQGAQPIIKDIFGGLLYLAQKSVIHRDLKVANVFLHNGKAKIADFGFAKFTKESFKDINIGSPIYMSPEGLINNVYGPKTDIWAFGVLIYELLHGETPFAHCRTEAELKYNVGIPINPKKFREELSQQIKDIMRMCMETDQSKRASAFQLQKLPYFKRLMEKSPLRRIDSPVFEKKFSSASQKLVAPVFPQPAVRQTFLNSKQQNSNSNININRHAHQKSSSPMPYADRETNNLTPYQKRGVSTEKRTYQFGRDRKQSSDRRIQVIQQKNTTPSSQVFSSSFTFKECVNILHYCRLVYKYVVLLKEAHLNEQNQIRILSGWVLYLMEQIKTKIYNRGIIYQGQNQSMREKKLKQVTNQYTKKYGQQLGEYPSVEMPLVVFLNYAKSFYEKIDVQVSLMKDNSWLPLAHYIVMIVDCTYLLKTCFEEHNYRALGSYKELQVFLNKNKDTMDIHSYKVFRKKISFIK